MKGVLSSEKQKCKIFKKILSVLYTLIKNLFLYLYHINQQEKISRQKQQFLRR